MQSFTSSRATMMAASVPFQPRLRLLVVAAMLLAWQLPALAQQVAESAASDAVLPTVTVTANKREQSLDSINGSVVVVDQSQLEAAQVRSTQDLARVLPGVQMSGSGSFLFPIVSVRGVTSAQDFYNPALTMYVDGVPQLPVFMSQSLLDVDRVELLKGPQGTLYGKSAEGGVLNIVTRQPDNQVHVRVSAGLSSRGGNLLETSLATPLVKDMLYASVALRHDNQPGDLRNSATGASDQGGVRSESGILKLRLAPAGSPWQAGLSVGRDCARASQDAYVPFEQIDLRTAYVQTGMPSTLSSFYQYRCGDSEALDASYDFEQWRLTASSAWQQVDITRSYPIGPYYSQQPEQWRQDVQELRLASRNTGRRAWDGVFGLYRQAVGQSRRYINDLPTYGLNGSDTASHNETQTVAAYSDVTWHATERLDLSAGLRMAQDRANIVFKGTTLDFTTYGTNSYSGASSTDGNSALGKLSAGFRLDPVWRVFANVAQGYKPGGYNLAPSSVQDAQAYARERATSYETGARFKTATTRGSLALYRIDVKDAQLYRGDSLGYQTLHNVGDTRSSGIEFDLAWDVSKQWTLTASGFINRARFTRYDDPSACATCSGNDVPFAPRRALTLGLQGDLNSPFGAIRPQLTARYQSAQYFDTANQLRQPAYTLIDTSVAWQARTDTEVSVYAHNLTDRAYRTYAFSSSALGSYAQVATGRTLGVIVTVNY
jgi:pesticin/yersiniabactin receptor